VPGYREIGTRMMTEASYAETHGFQVSSDMIAHSSSESPIRSPNAASKTQR